MSPMHKKIGGNQKKKRLVVINGQALIMVSNKTKSHI